MNIKASLLLACGLAAFGSFATASIYQEFDHAPRALVFNLKEGAANVGDCDGVYLITSYKVNTRVAYVNEAKHRFLALNGMGFWTIGDLDHLPSIVSGQTGTVQEIMESGSFTGFHWASKNTMRDPTLSWTAYDVRAEDVVAIAFQRTNMHSQDPNGAEGVYGLIQQQAWSDDAPLILPGTMDWSCDEESCSRTNVYVNVGAGKFLVKDVDGWVIDDVKNLDAALQGVSSVNKALRQHDEDVTQGWDNYTVAVSSFYVLDIEGMDASNHMVWGGKYVLAGEEDGKPVYRSDETNTIISFDADQATWEESGDPLGRRVPEDGLVDGMAWESGAVEVAVNYRLAEQSSITHPDVCHDLCAYTGGMPVPHPDASAPHKCFFTPFAWRSWEAAEKTCEMHGGALASISSEEENELALALFQASHGGAPRFWIGLSQATAEEWQWSDRSPLMYSDWSAGEPNDFGNGEDCAEIRTWSSVQGEWNDNSCANVQPFLCAKLYNPPPSFCSEQ